jgi:hypothetical protein
MKKEIEEKRKYTCTFRLIGLKGEIIKFEEIEDLINYFKQKGWQFLFEKSDTEKGWYVEFRK